jgi:glycosyltransferase involved in cell wall biosynthesis
MATSVLIVRPRLEPGGATEHITLLSRGLREAGVKVLLATAGGKCSDALREAGVEIIESRLAVSSPANLFIASAQLARVVRSRRVSLIHSHHRFGNLVGRLASRRAGVPLVVTVHEFRYNQRWLGKALAGDRTIAPSAALARHLHSHYGFDPGTIAVIPNALSIDEDNPCILGRLPPNRDSKEALAVGYIGRLSAEKGVRYFVESIPLAAKECPETRYLVFGGGPEEDELRVFARRLNIGDSTLSFRGWCDPREAMAGLDVVVIPSLEEGFGYVALEAMRASLPVVASSVGGLPEIIADRESGLLVPPRDPAAIAAALCALTRDPEMRLRLGRRGHAILVERFSLERMLRATIQVYESVLGHALVP